MKPCNKVKVLFILPSLCSGGAERILVTLMNNLDRDQFNPEFLALNEDGPIKEWINDDIPFHSFGHSSIKSSILKLYRLIKDVKPDVIFTTMVHTNALAILMKFFFPQLRVVVREAALPSIIISEYGLKGRFCWFVYKVLYPMANVVVSNCSQVIDQFRDEIRITIKNHQILFNPVDTERIFETIPDQFENTNERKETVSFVCVGRLSYEKGYERLIRQLKDFHAHKNWVLNIIGEGKYRQTLEKLILECGLENKIFLQGYHSNPWVLAAQSDCLLLPSHWEGMPNVVLEGFACGLPTIAMREAGGIVDIQKYASKEYLTVVDTMEQFMEAMSQIQPVPKNQKAKSILQEEFSLDHIMKQFEQILLPAPAHQK